jgi:Zn-dependent metalloprotease
MRCTIIPPYVLARLADAADARTATGSTTAEAARQTLVLDERLRGRRPHRSRETSTAPRPTPDEQGDPGDQQPRRRIRDAGTGTDLPGRLVRREGEAPTGDVTADEAYDGLGATHDLYDEAYGRDSLDGAGVPLRATVHYGVDYSNAFWDGTRMVFGDGDGEYFNRFTISLDIIGHELAHGVTENTADLIYAGQSGALNESMSDVFGSLVRQRNLGQAADEADWLIGAGLFTARVQGTALRSMRAPGTAYDDPVIGTDPQPGHLDDYVETSEDNGGVHINSGIPNRAFHLAATAIGGNAWEAAGTIWYAVLTGDTISSDCDFATFAALTVAEATARFGDGSAEATAVAAAWAQVGLVPAMAQP